MPASTACPPRHAGHRTVDRGRDGAETSRKSVARRVRWLTLGIDPAWAHRLADWCEMDARWWPDGPIREARAQQAAALRRDGAWLAARDADVAPPGRAVLDPR